MPNSMISSGVISEPPPTPVMPTRNPTPNPEIEYSGSIKCIKRVSSPVREAHLDSIIRHRGSHGHDEENGFMPSGGAARKNSCFFRQSAENFPPDEKYRLDFTTLPLRHCRARISSSHMDVAIQHTCAHRPMASCALRKTSGE